MTFEQRNNVNKSRQARSRPVPAHANSTQVYPRLTLGKRAIAHFLLGTDLLHNNFIVSILDLGPFFFQCFFIA